MIRAGWASLSFFAFFLPPSFAAGPSAGTDEILLSRECARLVTAFSHAEEGQRPAALPLAELFADLVPVSRDRVEAAMSGIHDLFVAIYGSNYTAEALAPVNEPILRESRTLLHLLQAAKRNFVPLEVLLGIEERASAHLARVDGLRARIKDLRADLGPEVEYLTPAALAAVDIFKEVGRSRNLAGGGARASLRPVARSVQDNLDEMFRSVSALSVFDDTLHDTLILVADLIKRGVMVPANDKKLRDAIHNLIVSNFSVLDCKLPPEAIATFKKYARPGTRGFTPQDSADLASAIDRIEKWQSKLEAPLKRFSETYYRGRIAFNVLSLMTRPNGVNGIPLGSPMRDAWPSLDCHPNVLNMAVRAYDGRKCFLNLSIGEMVDSDIPLRQVLAEQGIDAVERRLLGRLVRDDRMYWAFLRSFEHELQRAVELLETEKKARNLTIVGQVVGRVSGGITREKLNQTRFVRSILPGKFIDALVSQVETGTLVEGTDPNSPRAAKTRRRKVQDLPPSLVNFIKGDTKLFPWAKQAPVIAVPVVAEPTDASSVEDQPDPPKKEGTSPEASVSIDPKTTGEVTRYFWDILDRFEDRALELLERDMSIQREAELSRGVDHRKIGQLADEVHELLVAALRVQGTLEACFRSLGMSMEDAEETLAWHLLKRAPNLAMYVVVGPPGLPGIDPPVVTGQAGLGWRIVMLAPRLAYGDGIEDEPVFVQDPAKDPNPKVRRLWKYIGVAAASAALSIGGPKVADRALEWIGVRAAPPSAPIVAPVEPGAGSEVKPKPPTTDEDPAP